MNHLLFIKQQNQNARWIDNDIRILKDSFELNVYDVETKKTIVTLLSLVKQFFFHIKTLRKYRVFYIWFADFHSVIPVLFSRLLKLKCIIVIGGYDADELLIQKLGNIKTYIRRLSVLYSVKKADLLLPVSAIQKNHLDKYVSPAKSVIIYNCVNTNTFNINNNIPIKENLIITIGGGGSYVKEALRKRLDLFIEIGEEFSLKYPEYNAKFYLIGHNKDTDTYKFLLQKINNSNIIIKPHTKTNEELISYLTKASIYMQLSYYEAFGVAQVEAMLYGCIPVSNPGGAIREIIGDAGFIVNDYNKSEYLQFIKEILDKKHELLRSIARNRVLTHFSLQARKDKLLNVLNSLIS